MYCAVLVLCRLSLLLKQASNLHCGPGSRLELLSGCGRLLICVLVGRDNTLRFYSKQLERRRMKSWNLAALHIWLFAQQRGSAMFRTNKVGLAACIHTVTSASKMAAVCERRCDWRRDTDNFWMLWREISEMNERKTRSRLYVNRCAGKKKTAPSERRQQTECSFLHSGTENRELNRDRNKSHRSVSDWGGRSTVTPARPQCGAE